MDWTQTITIIGTIAGLVFYMRKEHREDVKTMDANHREDVKNMDASMQRMDDKWAKLFGLFVEKFDLNKH
jgi:hypothetical protein